MTEKHPEEAAFLAAIAAAPDDHLPRLVFADWLEERNDPRAAWLRDAEVWEWIRQDVHNAVPIILDHLAEGVRGGQGAWPRVYEVLHTLGSHGVVFARRWVRAQPEMVYPALRRFLEDTPPSQLRPVELLTTDLHALHWFDVWVAVTDLGFHGRAAAPAVPDLLKLDGWALWPNQAETEPEDRPIENAVFRALGRIGPAAMAAVPMLAGSLWQYETAGQALLMVRPDPDLIVDHMNADEIADAVKGLRLANQLADDPIRFLLRTARRCWWRKTHAALELLAEYGGRATTALPGLAKLRTDSEDPRARQLAEKAIRRIRDTS